MVSLDMAGWFVLALLAVFWMLMVLKGQHHGGANVSKGNMRPVVWILAIIAIVAVGALLLGNGGIDKLTIVDGADDADIPDEILGKSSTITLNAFTGLHGEAGSETEVYPTYTVLVDGSKKVNDVGANSTTGSVGDELSAYCTGASYYCDAVEDRTISKVEDTVELDAYAVVATTDLVLTAFDSNEDALTADDGANNSADYAGGNVLANDQETYYIKMEQTGADKSFFLGAICTWVVGAEADNFELVASGWTEVGVPDKLDSTTITMYDDGNTSTAEKGYKQCYVPDEIIILNENDDTGKLKFIFDSDDTTQPTANGDTYFGAVFLDTSFSVNEAGEIVQGFYMVDGTEDPGAVGIDENPDTTWNGLDVAVAIEPQ